MAVSSALWVGFLIMIPTSSAAEGTLAEAAKAKGRFFGVSVLAGQLDDSQYVDIINKEFSAVTPENSMKWDATEPSRGSFSYGNADRIVSSVGEGKTLRGHVLVWHQQLPSWVKELSGSDEVQQAMDDHIAAVAGHFQGKVDSWDVVNEAFEGDGSRRHSVFQDQIGDGFIEHAFRSARAADGGAKLCYNDYGIESKNAKSDAIYAMVQDFKARDVPIDCVGFQSHLGSSAPGGFQDNLQRFTDLGVEVQLTELDISGASPDAYSNVVGACLAVSRCTGIIVWGVRDSDSWRDGSQVLFDGSGEKKEAYDAVLNTLDA